MARLTRDERTNRRHWDREAAAYAKRHHRELTGDVRWGPRTPPEAELRILGDVAGRDVLEVGCGGGEAIVHLKAACGVRRAAGCDLSEARIAQARAHAEREGAKVDLLACPASDLSPFADASFDVVFSAFAYGFVERINEAFAEAARVLRPGGLFAFSWFSPLYQIVEWDARRVVVVEPYYDRLVHRDEGTEAGPWTEFRRTYGDWLAALRGAGLVATDIVEPPPERRRTTYTEAFPLRVERLIPGTMIWRARKA